MDLSEIGFGVCAGFFWLRIGPVASFMNTVMNFRVP